MKCEIYHEKKNIPMANKHRYTKIIFYKIRHFHLNSHSTHLTQIQKITANTSCQSWYEDNYKITNQGQIELHNVKMHGNYTAYKERWL